MQTHSPNAGAPPRWKHRLRLALGQAQVFGAAFTLVFLLQEGISPRVLWGAGATGVLSLLSLLLFRVVWKSTGH